MNILRDISNIVLYSLFLLDAAYSFVVNNKVAGKLVKKTSSEKDLHALTLNINANLKPHIKSRIKYIESIEYLDDGEVAWEIPVKIFSSDEQDLCLANAEMVDNKLVEYKSNPKYSILSGVVKGLNKELFSISTVYDLLVTWKTHAYFSNIALLVFVSVFKYASGLVIQVEVDALKNSYKETRSVKYMEQYIKIRRYTSTVLLILAFVLTKNVQIAE